jgi:acetate---CoA ligase (ADP-forming)
MRHTPESTVRVAPVAAEALPPLPMPPSLDAIFRPRSVALVGATTRAHAIGAEILKNILDLDFNGELFPVNNRAGVVRSMRAYKSVSEIPAAVDFAILVVPKESVIETVDACGEKGVKGVVIITAGFREVGGEGVLREQRLAERLRHWGIRAIGPNCMGIINTDPEIRLNATFSRTRPLSGNIGFITQSGALGDAIIDFAKDLNLGFSLFASIGNRVDVTVAELLAYMGDDPRTDVILLYLESLGSPREFFDVARRVAARKPIVVVKAGRSVAGAKAAMSHTGSIAGADSATDALLAACGVMRVETVEELFDVAQILASQPLPQGTGVSIVTNAGGPGIMATDAVSAVSLQMAEMNAERLAALAPHVHPDASLRNPVDLIASATPAHYLRTLQTVLDDPACHMALAIFVPIVMVDHAEMAEAIIDAWRPYRDTKPLAVCLMGRMEAGRAGVRVFHREGVPVYEFPESAVRAMSFSVEYRLARERLTRPRTLPTYNVTRSKADRIVANTGALEGGIMPGEDLSELLRIYGIETAPAHRVSELEEAAEAADSIGYPVVLKLLAPGLVHKTDVGGVITDIRGIDELVAAFRRMRDVVRDTGIRGSEFIVQRMLKGGKELIVGATLDPQLGHVLMCGLGGIYVEEIRDVAFKLAPVSLEDAHELMASLRGYAILKGVRGEQAVDFDFAADLICRTSVLVTNHPDIAEIEFNPVIVSSPGRPSCVVDARVRVTPTASGPSAS